MPGERSPRTPFVDRKPAQMRDGDFQPSGPRERSQARRLSAARYNRLRVIFMTFMDLVSLVGLLLSAVSFATSSVGKLAKYKRELLAVGFVLFGFVLSRVLYTYLPPGHQIVELHPRLIVWSLVLTRMAIVVLVALKKEGSYQAAWVVFLFFVYLSLYGKSVGLVETFKLRDNEIIAAVELNERSADFDRAIEILEWTKEDRTREEQKVLDARIGVLRSRKAERLARPQ